MGRDPQPQELTIAKGVRQGEDHREDGARRAVAVDQQGSLGMALRGRIDLLGPKRSIRLRHRRREVVIQFRHDEGTSSQPEVGVWAIGKRDPRLPTLPPA